MYSIDEAFIDLTHVPKNELIRVGHLIRNTILQWTGIPVGVGIASTKTLAKLANRQAKKYNGVASFFDQLDLDSLLKTLPVNDVWSINRKLMRRLHEQNIQTVFDLKQVDNNFLMEHFSVLVMRTVFELRGVSCIPLSDLPKPKRGILNSRSFGQYVSDLETLRSAIAHHATHGAEELRAKGLCATVVMTYIRTNKNRSDHDQEYGTSSNYLLTPTDYTPAIVKAAIHGLEQCWKPGHFYQKAGVMLLELVPEGVRQRSLLDIHDDVRADKLMSALDNVNKTFGRGTLKFGTEGFNKAWLMRRNHKSPGYTTHWHELLRI
jgi:DNA polymerase V